MIHGFFVLCPLRTAFSRAMHPGSRACIPSVNFARNAVSGNAESIVARAFRFSTTKEHERKLIAPNTVAGFGITPSINGGAPG